MSPVSLSEILRPGLILARGWRGAALGVMTPGGLLAKVTSANVTAAAS
ncbi:MAG: hypothetical protein WA715_18080 [Candidatus Acidiferrum sp.]